MYVTGSRVWAQKSVLKSYINGKIYFLILKDRHHERSIKPVSASYQQLN
jgi:hypothetical protein